MSNLSTPTADQLAAARLAHWRQNADPILTINMLRDWLNTSGLVLFTPRAAHLPVPAPSFLEATFGSPNPAPTLADTEPSRNLLSRLILDGGAIPLNLLGNPTGVGTETPDYLVSPLAFPYIFTLRGDKAWKQPPATTGATKVSTLALNAYTLLSDRAKDTQPGLSAYDLATQLGKEVTETAVLRALTELWQHLRVLPIPQHDGAPTLWELTATRFTKQIKAGANAGQPTALSALISLYLGQAIVASEEEVETFLSPIAARSRIRDVIHALLAARQLETVAVEGRTVLHVAGELPAFLAIPIPADEAPAQDDIDFLVVTSESDTPEASVRIKEFIPKPRKVGTGFVTRPGRNSEDRPTPRERRPFTRESGRPAFTKPWEEEKAARLAAAQSPSRVQDQADATPRPKPSHPYDRKPATDRKPSFDREGKRPPFSSKRPFGDKPRLTGDRPAFKSDRPSFRRDQRSSDTRPQRREFTPRPYSDESGSDRPRKTYSKPGAFDRKREGFAGKPSFRRDSDSHRDSSDSRPPRRPFDDKSDKPSFSGPRKPGSFSARPPRSFDEGSRSKAFAPRKDFSRGSRNNADSSRARSGPPFRKFDSPRPPRPRAASDFDARPSEGLAGKKPFGKTGGSSFEAKKTFRKSGESFAKKSSRPYTEKSSSAYAKKSGGSFAGKKTYAKSAKPHTAKPASTFDKFKGNKKPFGKRTPTRKFKPREGESAG